MLPTMGGQTALNLAKALSEVGSPAWQPAKASPLMHSCG